MCLLVSIRASRMMPLSMKILFIRLAAIGDVVQAGAALRIYKNSFPEISLDWVVASSLVPLVKSFGVADRVIGIKADDLLRGPFVRRIFTLCNVMRSLGKLGAYDAVYCAHPDWRYGLAGLLVKSGRKLFPKNMSRYGGYIYNRNRVFEYYRLLTDTDSGELEIDAALSSIGNSLLSHLPSNVTGNYDISSKYMVLIPGGAKNALRDDWVRRWPVDFYVRLADRLIERGYQVVLMGGTGDYWVNEYFYERPVINLIGKTNLLEMVGVFSGANCVVAHDSGPLHLASITKVPLVGLFGPTSANAVLSFSRPSTIALQNGNLISCSPCYDGKSYASCASNDCLKSITVADVLFKIDLLLQKHTI